MVWGAGLLATWYAAVPPASAPAGAAPAQPPDAAASVPDGSEIEREAARLQGQLRPQAEFIAPTRNPFRFGSRVEPRGPAPVDVPPVGPAEPPPPLVALVGIAADRTADTVDRTAILSTSGGVVLARTGDDVAGRYRVASIDENAVELTDTVTGVTRRLTFTP
jgi:hypothetical protein